MFFYLCIISFIRLSSCGIVSDTNFSYNNHPASLFRPTQPNLGTLSSLPSPLVSIIVPFTCNKLDTVRATLRSVRRQTLADHEVIIVNDGCQRKWIQARLDGYAVRDSRILIHHLPVNRGLPHARNILFSFATAQYVFMLDADDLLEPTAAEKLLWFLHSSPQLAFAKGFSVGFDGKEYLWRGGFEQSRRFLKTNWVTPSCLLRKATHAIVGGFTEEDITGLEDWDFWLKCASKGLWGATVPEFLDWYRVRPTQSSDWPALLDLDHARAKFASRYPLLFSNYSQISRTRLYNVPSSLFGTNVWKKREKQMLLFIPWMRVGGADHFALDTVRLFRTHGWGITIVTTIPHAVQEWEHAFLEHTRDVFVLDRFLPNLSSKLHFIAYLMRSRQPDLVLLTNSELAYAALPVIHWALGPQRPAVIDYIHMLEPEWRDGGYAKYSMEFSSYLSSTIVSSNSLKAHLPKQRVTTCYIGSGLSTKNKTEREFIRKLFNIENDVPVILYVARMVPQKRPDMAAEILSRLFTRVRFAALIVGDGPLLEELQSNLTSSSVHFVSHVGPEQMPALINAADIGFLPSANEGISLFAYEAMAMGKVFVGSAVGGQRELVTEDCGILVEPSASRMQEVSEYVAALEHLVRNTKKRTSFGRNARIRIARREFRTEEMFNCLLGSLNTKNTMLPLELNEKEAFRRAHDAAENMSSWAV